MATHSKDRGKAIENAFLQSYQQLFVNNLTEDFLEVRKL